MKHSIKNPFPLDGKTASASTATASSIPKIEKMEKNWFTPNFKNCVHQQKKALNKSTKFVINQKSVSTSQNEEFLEKCDFSEPKSYLHSNKYLKKIKKMVSSSINKIFLKNWLLPNWNDGFQNNVNERISFPPKRKSVATGCNKGFV